MQVAIIGINPLMIALPAKKKSDQAITIVPTRVTPKGIKIENNQIPFRFFGFITIELAITTPIAINHCTIIIIWD